MKPFNFHVVYICFLLDLSLVQSCCKLPDEEHDVVIIILEPF